MVNSPGFCSQCHCPWQLPELQPLKQHSREQKMGRLGRTKGISLTESDFLKGPNQKFHLMLVCVWTRIQSQPLLDTRKDRKSLSFGQKFLQKEEDHRIRGIKQQSMVIFLHVFFFISHFSFHSDFLLYSIEIIPARVISKPLFC